MVCPLWNSHPAQYPGWSRIYGYTSEAELSFCLNWECTGASSFISLHSSLTLEKSCLCGQPEYQEEDIKHREAAVLGKGDLEQLKALGRQEISGFTQSAGGTVVFVSSERMEGIKMQPSGVWFSRATWAVFNLQSMKDQRSYISRWLFFWNDAALIKVVPVAVVALSLFNCDFGLRWWTRRGQRWR